MVLVNVVFIVFVAMDVVIIFTLVFRPLHIGVSISYLEFSFLTAQLLVKGTKTLGLRVLEDEYVIQVQSSTTFETQCHCACS